MKNPHLASPSSVLAPPAIICICPQPHTALQAGIVKAIFMRSHHICLQLSKFQMPRLIFWKPEEEEPGLLRRRSYRGEKIIELVDGHWPSQAQVDLSGKCRTLIVNNSEAHLPYLPCSVWDPICQGICSKCFGSSSLFEAEKSKHLVSIQC